MRLWGWVGAAIGVSWIAVWLLTRRPVDPRDHLSAKWRDAHLREPSE